jgi:hypothetical protein
MVIGDANQRRPVVETRGGQKQLTENYLGVALWSGPEALLLGTKYVVEMVLLYYPDVSYDEVEAGATFTMREGARIVAFGRILEILEIENPSD